MSKLVLSVALACALLAPPASATFGRVFVVNADDDQYDEQCTRHHCNLREAIRAANRTRGRIRFDLPAFPYRIEVTRALPAIRSHVTLDGASQRGAACPMPLVHIDGSQLDADDDANGLELRGRGSSIHGVVITNFPGHGIVVDGNENVVRCSYVGVGPDGLEPHGNGGHGIGVAGGHSNRIGGAQIEDINLVGANAGQGVYIEDALNTYLHNNAIGVDLFGNAKLPNGNAALPQVNPPPGPSPIRNPRVLARVQKILTERAASLVGATTTTLEDTTLYETYVRLLRREPVEVVPKTLDELITVLAHHPKLYAAFTRDAADILAARRATGAAEFARLARVAQVLVPAFGRDAEPLPEDNRDVTGELLATYAPDDYVLSGPPSDIVAVLAEDGPILPLDQITWHSMETYGPVSFDVNLFNLRTCNGPTSTCHWPIAYDLYPATMQILWQSQTLTQQQMNDVVQENGYLYELRLNGQLLERGGPVQDPANAPPAQRYYAASIPDEPCPAASNCFATNLFVRNRIAQIPQPWTFQLIVKQLAALDAPRLDCCDENGFPIIVTHEYVEVTDVSRVVLPNPEFGHLKWFAEGLYEIFQHPRCADCHGFEDFDGLATHHGYSDTQAFVDSVNLHLEPSLYVPGAHVMACTNCHNVPQYDNFNVPFHETEWVAPYFDLDVNWSEKTASEICSRVKSNLPTQQLREQHFHGDGRLFWAVQEPKLPGGMLLEAAPPGSFFHFLRRIDRWNTYGAPCP